MTTADPTASCFIEPLDVLFLRGNKLFGDPGSYGESLVPPWPSVAAGALRSRILADDGVDLAAFACNDIPHPTLGTPAQPGSFAVTAFHLARRHANGRVEQLIAPPADLVITARENAEPLIRRLHPTPLANGLHSSAPLALLPILAEPERGKPAGGYWLSEKGWARYLAGDTPAATDFVKSSDLWKIDDRIGVGLDPEKRRAADHKLFSMQAIVMQQHTQAGAQASAQAGFNVGFLASVTGSPLPQGGMLRFGGDGRAAGLHAIRHEPPSANLDALCAARRCRIVLTSPGVFSEGWRLPGADEHGHFELHGVRARLVCAAVPRAETISGWDLARRQPKAAQRAAPAGSVYWLDELDATPAALGKLAAAGLWREPGEDPPRRAEGFNRFAFATY